MDRLSRISIALVIAAIFTFGGVSPASADENHKAIKIHAHDLSDVWAIARGGQLYDNWIG